MKKNFHALGKRALALLVSLTMCVSLLQITAFAAEGEGAADTGSETSASNTSTPEIKNTTTTEKESSTDPESGSTTTGSITTGTTEDGNITVNIDSTNKTTPIEPVKDENGDVTVPGKTETTESIKTEITDKGELDLDNAKVEEGQETQISAGEKQPLGTENADLELNIEASATVKPGDKGTSGSGEFEIKADKLESTLKTDSGYDDTFKTVTDENGNFIEYVKEITNVDGSRTIITIAPKKDGDIVTGYVKTTRTETTTPGEFDSTNASNKGDPITSDSNITVDLPGDISTVVKVEDKVPQPGDTIIRGEHEETVTSVEQSEDGKYTVTYSYQLPVLDSNGTPVVDEDGNPVTETKTRTEILSGTYETTTNQQTVTEKREDTVTIVETTVEKDVTLGDKDGKGSSLTINLEMEAVKYGFGNEGHGTLYHNSSDKTKPGEMETGSGLTVNDVDDDGHSQTTTLDTLNEKFGLIRVDEVAGATVTVKQKTANDTNFEASITVDLTPMSSKLDGNLLKLVVKQGDTEKVAYLFDNDKDSSSKDVTLVYDGDKIVGVRFDGVDAATFSLQLTGHQRLSDNVNEGESAWAQIDMTSTVKVTVSGVTASITGTEQKKESVRTDVVTAERTETTTTINSSVTSVLEDFLKPVIPAPVQPDPGDNTDPGTNPGDNTNPGGNGGGTGGGGGTTPTPPVDIPDDPNDVPLEPGPGDIDNPDVPENPGDVDIEEPDVPLAPGPDTPSDDVNITDNDVPMANKPSKPAGKNPVPQSSATGLTEIEEEAVPLAEVPKTGDNSAMWIAAAVLAACGLVALGQKKREEA